MMVISTDSPAFAAATPSDDVMKSIALHPRHRRLMAFYSLLLSLIPFVTFAVNGPGPTPRPPLLPEEKTTIDIFKRVSPAVVSVANQAVLRDVYSMRVYEVPQGAGSGFIWDKKGHIVSNFHVVYEASAIDVSLRNGTNYPATVIGVDPDHDIAVLKIDAPEKDLTPVTPGTSADLEVGQYVLAIGNPFGLDTSLSVGIVSALGRSMMAMTGRQITDVIQTDAAINPGNSGGPLLDSAGCLIGMNTAIMSTSGSYAGVGFAVPVDIIRRIVPQLIRDGKVKRAGLGIQVVPDHIMRQAGKDGVGIYKAVPHGAAAKAGLEGMSATRRGRLIFGDIIIAVDGAAVQNNDDFLTVLDRHQAGDKVTVSLLRGGEKRSVDVILQDLE